MSTPHRGHSREAPPLERPGFDAALTALFDTPGLLHKSGRPLLQRCRRSAGPGIPRDCAGQIMEIGGSELLEGKLLFIVKVVAACQALPPIEALFM
jgi:hypothetical protein